MNGIEVDALAAAGFLLHQGIETLSLRMERR